MLVTCNRDVVGADIDTLCVAPRHIEHRDFFDTFYKKLAACDEVRNLHVSAVPGQLSHLLIYSKSDHTVL